MSQGKDRAKAVCILGMHRSGTSAITRAVNLLGVFLGEEKDIMSPLEDNPLGFWERDDVVDLHERILSHFKRPWDTPLSLPDGWHLSEEAGPFRNELLTLVKNNFSGKKLWGWKDPRTCLTLELWKDVLRELDIELACLFAVRNPLDVARSLEKRDGFSRDKAFGIWFNYNVAALKATSGLPRVFISYDRFLEDWETELKRCAAGLGVPWPGDDTPLKEEMKTFIRPGLRHSKSGVRELEEANSPEPVIELYELLTDFLNGSVKTEMPDEKVDGLAEEFSSYARFFREDMGGGRCKKTANWTRKTAELRHF